MRDTKKRTTTNLEELEADPRRFIWGEPVRWRTHGPYAVLEFHPWKRDGSSIKTGEPDESKTDFHLWVDRKSTSESFGSLDAALAGGIAYRAEGANHAADRYFIRALGIQNEGDELATATAKDLARQLADARKDIVALAEKAKYLAGGGYVGAIKRTVLEAELIVRAQEVIENYR